MPAAPEIVDAPQSLAITADASVPTITDPEVIRRLEALLEEGTSENTARARVGELRRFWGDEPQRYPVPLPALIGWMSEALERWSVATVERTIRTLSRAHHAAGIDGAANPCRSAAVREILRAAKVRRAKRGGQSQARAVRIGDVRRMVGRLAEDLPGLRDRALLWTLYASGLRESEAAALDVEALERHTRDDGGLAYVLRIRRSKADQIGEGSAVAMAGAAAEALAEWITAAGIAEGPVFRGFYKGGRSIRPSRLSVSGIRAIVRELGEVVGLEISPHGLRAGFATDAVEHGVTDKDVMAGRWKSPQAFSRYTRARRALDNPAAYLTA